MSLYQTIHINGQEYFVLCPWPGFSIREKMIENMLKH